MDVVVSGRQPRPRLPRTVPVIAVALLVFGALTVAFVPVAIQASGFGAQAQSLVYGIFIIIVVALTTARTRDTIIK